MVRWNWHNQLSLPNPPSVKQGVLDLRGLELEHSRIFPMDGEWLFSPEQWIGASHIAGASQGQMLQVPGNWNAVFDPANKEAYGILAHFGVFAEEREGHVSETKSFMVPFAQTNQVELNLFVRASNQESPLKGGNGCA